MSNQDKLVLYEELKYKVGDKPFLDSTAENGNCVVFEEDDDTAYFYKYSRTKNSEKVLDALHIYNVVDISISSKEKESVVQIAWNDDETKAFLILNNYCHAVYDYTTSRGYCRNGIPELKISLFKKKVDRKLTDEILEELYQK